MDPEFARFCLASAVDDDDANEHGAEDEALAAFLQRQLQTGAVHDERCYANELTLHELGKALRTHVICLQQKTRGKGAQTGAGYGAPLGCAQTVAVIANSRRKHTTPYTVTMAAAAAASEERVSVTELLRREQKRTYDWVQAHQMSDVQSFISKRSTATIATEIENIGFQSHQPFSQPKPGPKTARVESQDY